MPPLNRPSWLSVAVGSLLLTVATSLLTVAVNYGRQETAISSLTARNDELNKDKDKTEKTMEEMRKSYETLRAQLEASNSKLQELKHDRCSPLAEQVRYQALTVTASINPSSYETANAQEVLKGYQASLQACYAARY
ncbi:hypothetical protein [Pseudomonas syringae]|uniref:hypothetical protein n=1 Tax=Pseudomonas syringae TaxID=317 RepID=UPI0010104797|nr:hypothetical protein [Pseudomonas syringae]QNR42554.1 hypothetical protein D5S12_14890 [Pseudomonas syringae]RXT61662.1 hypothetical protein B1F71_25610 [Pseudomonas syringae]RXT90999.1 hypothetical protein B1F75_20110 [Pseudomonas syringae]